MIKTIDECFSLIQNGANIKQGDVDGGFPITRIETITNDKFSRDRMGYAGITDISKYTSYLLEDGDLLMSHINSVQYLGRTVLYVKQSDETIIHGMNLLRLKARRDVINPAYAKYCFYGHPFRSQIRKITKKSVNQASFAVKDLKQIKLNIPALSEQNEIVMILDKIQQVLAHRIDELSKLDDLIKARFVEMFEKGNHEIVKASEICDFITKGTTPTTGEIAEEYNDGKIPFLKVYNLSFTGEMLFENNPQYIPKETHDGKLARSKVYPNDVLMNIVGPPLGKFALVTDEFDEWNINQAIAIFRAKDRILPRFLLHALMQPKVLEPFIGQAVGIRQQNLSLEQCRSLQIPLPSLEEQQSFVEFAKQVDKSKVKVQKALDETQKLFDSLMQQYFG